MGIVIIDKITGIIINFLNLIFLSRNCSIIISRIMIRKEGLAIKLLSGTITVIISLIIEFISKYINYILNKNNNNEKRHHMSPNDRFSIAAGCIFLIIFIYTLYIKSYLYALGWLILSAALLLEAYTPRKIGDREILIIINVALPFIALGIFIYTLIYG